jgi:hypothetical protein
MDSKSNLTKWLVLGAASAVASSMVYRFCFNRPKSTVCDTCLRMKETVKRGARIHKPEEKHYAHFYA